MEFTPLFYNGKLVIFSIIISSHICRSIIRVPVDVHHLAYLFLVHLYCWTQISSHSSRSIMRVPMDVHRLAYLFLVHLHCWTQTSS